MRLLGEENIAKVYGSLHKNTRNMIRRVFGPENLRLVLLHDMQGAVEKTLSSWHDSGSVELKPALSSVCIRMHESIHVDQHLLYILMAFLLGYGITQPLFIYLFICLCRWYLVLLPNGWLVTRRRYYQGICGKILMRSTKDCCPFRFISLEQRSTDVCRYLPIYYVLMDYWLIDVDLILICKIHQCLPVVNYLILD